MLRCPTLLAVALAATPLAAQDRAATLAAHLDRVPAAALALFDGAPEIDFGDLAAAARATASPPPGTSPVYATPEGAAWRAAIAPFADSLGMADGWPATTGFALADVQSWSALVLPPQRLALVALDPALQPAVTAALLANGHAPADRAYPAWFRNDADFGVDMAARDPAFPFGGMLGQASRIAFAGPFLLASSGWPLIDAAMTADGTSSLADRPDIAALLASLDTLPPSDLVTARLATDARNYSPVTGVPSGQGVPPWSAALFADLSDGATAIAVIALSYATQDLAAAAAQAMARQWQEAPLPGSGQTLATMSGTPLAVTVTGTGPFVALAAAIAPTTLDNGRILNAPHDLLTRVWYRGELALIAPAP